MPKYQNKTHEKKMGMFKVKMQKLEELVQQNHTSRQYVTCL